MNSAAETSGALLLAKQEQTYWADRIEAELEFADGLLRLQPKEAEKWKPALAAARKAAAATSELKAACAAAEQALAPLAKAAKSYGVICVGHGHIDMNWLWSYPETVHVVNDTFDTMLRLMDEYPGFCYSQSQASVYRIVEQHNPEMLRRIAKRIKSGHWEVTASHWVEGDKNIAGGEALCRHLLYTRRYMKKLFGLKPEDVPIDWSPDTFGHAATVPTYLVRGGVKYLYLHRPGVYTKDKPDLFWWEGPDGSRVLVRNDMRQGYNGRVSAGVGRVCREYAERCGVKECMFLYGVGDHGGGPTRRDVEYLIDLATWPIFPKVRFGTSRQFFDAVSKEKGLPLVKGELNTEFTGCYTTQSLIKKCNRFAEARLGDAEFAAALAARSGGAKYPAAKLEEAWRDTLFSHFHDILPGSGIHDTRTYTHGRYQETMATTAMIETLALRGLAEKIDTAALVGSTPEQRCHPSHLHSGQGGGVGMWTEDGKLSPAEILHYQGSRPYVFFNSTGVDREEVVEVTLWDRAPDAPFVSLRAANFAVRGPDKKETPAQKISDSQSWGHEFVKLSFPVRVPAWGYAVYVVRELAAGESCPAPAGGPRLLEMLHHCRYSLIERKVIGLENGLLRVELDPLTCGIRKLTDLKSGAALIDEPAGAFTLQFGVERVHGMSAWLVDHFKNAGAPEATAVRSTLNGPHLARIEVDLTFGNDSEFTLIYELRRDDPNLYLAVRGRWGERGSNRTGIPALRARFPLALQNAKAEYEIPFGAVGRDLCAGEEVPALRWAGVTGACAGKARGCLLLNDSKHGHALDGGVLNLSLIRGSYDPDPLPEIGQHEIKLALRPFFGKLSAAEATHAAQAFNHPLRVVGAPVRQGGLPATLRGLSLEGEGLAVSGLKLTEDGGGMIVRVYECAGKKATGRLTVEKALWGTVAKAAAADLLEQEQPTSALKVKANAVEFEVPARGIVSVLLGFKK